MGFWEVFAWASLPTGWANKFTQPKRRRKFDPNNTKLGSVAINSGNKKITKTDENMLVDPAGNSKYSSQSVKVQKTENDVEANNKK